jgi:hypothetical protein
LAFLAYDFFGRIVEKAIFLRNLEKMRLKGQSPDETKMMLELKDGEQLTPEDIERAMEDPDIKPLPLYSSDGKTGPQLYFGPGFEDRLEMELEELIGGEMGVSEEDAKIREEEDALFAKLAGPPPDDLAASLLDGIEDDEGESVAEAAEDKDESISVDEKLSLKDSNGKTKKSRV